MRHIDATPVTLAKAGVQGHLSGSAAWIPAFAGMTNKDGFFRIYFESDRLR
jgi:hypothetical protein